jgi:hypothetical protein
MIFTFLGFVDGRTDPRPQQRNKQEKKKDRTRSRGRRVRLTVKGVEADFRS